MMKIVSFNPNPDKIPEEKKVSHKDEITDDILSKKDLEELERINNLLDSINPEEFSKKVKVLRSIGTYADQRKTDKYLYDYQDMSPYNILVFVHETPIEVFNTKPSLARAFVDLVSKTQEKIKNNNVEEPIDIEKYIKKETKKGENEKDDKQNPPPGLRVVR